MIEKINDNMVIICSNETKKEILKSITKLVNVKFYSLEEFAKNYYYKYDEKAILYLINKYSFNYNTSLEYLKNLQYIEEKKYNNEKLDFLVTIKKELQDNNLLIYNNKFKNYLNNKEIIIYNYNLSKFEKHLLKDIQYKIINTKTNNYVPNIYEFNDTNQEINFVAKSISDLIYKKVPLNKIKLTNINDDYIEEITKIFSFYNLKINKSIKGNIYSTIIGKTFYDNLTDNLDNAIEAISKYKDNPIYNQIIDICNKYIWCTNIKDLKILIYNSLKNTNISNNRYTNELEIVDLKDYNFTDEYVYLMNFNQGIIPHQYKDEEYLTDDIKPDYVDSVLEKNKLEKNTIINSIKNIKNLTITYKLKDDYNTYYVSSIINELNANIITPKEDYLVSYSELSDKLILEEKIDDLVKFSKKDDNLNILLNNYNIPYNTYSNSFTGLSKIKLNNYISNLKSFNLSYSSMDNYNRCSFRFYIEKILNLRIDNPKFSLTLGNIYHDVLEKIVKENIDIEQEINNYINVNNIELTNSDKFFLNNSIANIKFVVDTLNKHKSYSKLDKVDTEKFVSINLKDNINFVGFIDKILYGNIDNTLIGEIVDYKTYVKKPSLKYLKNGINIQLPTYMYLAKHIYEDIVFSGFYLQNITLNNLSEEEKEKSLKLIGYTNYDKNIIKNMDSSYVDSKVIEGLKVNSDGNYSSNSLKKMLSNEEITNLITKVEKIINNTLNNILESKFDINPKYDKQNIGCEFCEYKDICYMKEYNFTKIIGSKENEDE